MPVLKAPALFLVLSLGLTLGACQALPGDTSSAPADSVADTETANTTPPDVSLPDTLQPGTNEAIAWEALMGADGEYAAAAHYQAVLDAFGDVEPYKTIKASEDRHIDALIRALERYGVQVPENPYMGILTAPADLETAAREWAVGEIANVEMYDDLIEQATDDRLIRVLENLRRASLESHLPAFEKAAANGGTLDPDQMGQSNRN